MKQIIIHWDFPLPCLGLPVFLAPDLDPSALQINITPLQVLKLSFP
jgi:hypothetical protein